MNVGVVGKILIFYILILGMLIFVLLSFLLEFIRNYIYIYIYYGLNLFKRLLIFMSVNIQTFYMICHFVVHKVYFFFKILIKLYDCHPER